MKFTNDDLMRLKENLAQSNHCVMLLCDKGEALLARLESAEAKLDGYLHYTLPNGESYEASELIQTLLREQKATLARLEASELLNEMLVVLFRSAMSDDSNTGKVIRLQQVAQKLEFMQSSEENRQLVLNEFRAWRKAAGK